MPGVDWVRQTPFRATLFALTIVSGADFLWCAATGRRSSQTAPVLLPLISLLCAVVIRNTRQGGS